MSIHAIFFLPLNDFSTAASTTRRVALEMSRPIPSPSMTGMIGLSGTASFLFLTLIGWPSVGTTICLYLAIEFRPP